MTTSLAPRFLAVQQQIAEAARVAGRDPAGIRLLAVSKTQEPVQINALHALGQVAFGENYIQEALVKQPNCSPTIEWHCIGPVQSNKSRLVAEHFAWCQSLHSLKLARRLAEQRPSHLPPLHCCIQLHIGDEANKSGVSPAEALALAEAVVTLPSLCLRGVMCIPPVSDSVPEQRRYFAEAKAVYQQLQHRFEGIDTLSMGMSADLAAAIAEGSTMVRVGTALFGPRAKR